MSDAKVKYKWLTGGVEFLDVIPKTPSGKLLRRLLRDKARALRAKAKATNPGAETRIEVAMEARAKL